MRKMKKFLAFLLVVCMMAGYLPANVEAAEVDDTLVESLEKAKTYTDGITINNNSNDPSTVVTNFGTHFTWDNEKREGKKTYLYDWSYYNGVVFEGIEYLYEVTGEEAYKDYVVEYMSSMIASNGTWAKCTNNNSKTCAGYNSTHGADCYKTASLLLDAYEMTGDSRYLTMAATLYKDLDTAAGSYLLSKAGYNYRHTWASDSTPDLWLDGLYMILPFRAEYAKYSNDTEELDLIVDRMQWVSDNMYNSSKKLFYHAADNASSNSGTYWLRSMGWYAAAIVDIMDSMEGENLETMKKQLVKLVDGMKAYQNKSNGMWLNDVITSEAAKNPYETSGTSLICYAIMKAVNNGWLDESYADMATLAFKGICNNKLSATTLKDICYIGAPGSSNAKFYDNEGKGVGPFIMFYAEMQEYVNKQAAIVEKETKTVTIDGVNVTVSNIKKDTLTATQLTTADKELIEKYIQTEEYTAYSAFDLSAGLVEGEKATISITVPDDWDGERIIGLSVEDGKVVPKEGTCTDNVFSFEVDHFSAKGIAYSVAPVADDDNSVSGTGNLVGGKEYTLDTDGVTANKNYLIVNTNSGTGHALTNNGSDTPGSTEVDINDGKIIVPDDSKIAWVFSGSTSGTVGNNGRYVYPNDGSLSLNTSGTDMTIRNQGSGAYRLYRSQNNIYWSTDYYLRYNEGWTGYTPSWNSNTRPTVYLYELTSSSAGEAVTFTVTPKTATLAPEKTTTLTGTVAVDGENVDLSKCTITWASSDATKATVSEGTVTGVADGTANITATLSAVDGTALKENIVLTIPVTVQSKTIVEDSGVLTGNDPVITKQNVEPDFSNIKLTVTYNDGSKGVITVENGLVIEGYDITTIGYSYATISYAGKEYGNVRVTVEGNPYEGKEEATVYPEYPADGAVRIDKTAKEVNFETTGVVQIELDVAGVSVRQGVDAVLTIDVSNSMAWATGTTTDDFENNKLKEVMESVVSFAEIFLADNEDGTPTDNTISVVFFAGKDNEHWGGSSNTQVDSVLTACSKIDDINTIKQLANNTLFTGKDGNEYLIQLAYMDGNTLKTIKGQNRGDTNYDYAFWQTEQAVDVIKAANGLDSKRETHVIFMTDGCATNYNGTYYNGPNATNYHKPGTKDDYENNGAFKNLGGKAWLDWINESITKNHGNIYAKSLYEKIDGIYALGFDMANGSFSGISNWTGIENHEEALNNIVNKSLIDENGNGMIPVTAASNRDALNGFYESLAHELRYAGTNATVTDIVDSEFTLQLTQSTGTESAKVHGDLGVKPTIEIKSYELWTKAETDDPKLIGTRKTNADGTYIYTTLETVYFKDDGTEAYSNEVENGTKNIMSIADDGTVTIEAHLFTYTKTPEGLETFKWELGNITDQEVALSFYAYLKGSLEGERPKGLYYTNEEATLEYVDINDKHATQIFPIPAVAWGGASTSYEFYLVNNDGQPCDRQGNVIPFANRVIITGPYYEELYLNQEDEEKAKEIIAAYVLPAGYVLYDETAKYTVITASGNNEGSLTISEPNEGKAQTTVVVSATKPSYIQSRVAFGVNYKSIPTESEFELTPNKVVIDYGKQILIETDDSEKLEDGYKATLVGFSKYYESVDMKQKFSNTSALDNFKAAYGTFSVIDAAKRTVKYTPTAFVNDVENIFCVVKMTNKSNADDYYYMVDMLSVIPATNVYYETDFANVFELATTGSAWTTNTVSGDSELTTDADKVQNDGTIGVNQTYGYDSTYIEDAYLSDGSSAFVEGAGVKKTMAKFSFKGTGFDLISRTGAKQGSIRVDIYTDEARTAANRIKSVTVLNKSESNLELYQIPVVSVNDLAYSTYFVTIGVSAAYDDPEINELDRGGEFYFDAIRVYDPAKGNAVAEAAYVADGESEPIITEVREQLIDASDYDAINASGSVDGMSFIDKTQAGADVATYSTIGPNNEVYLSEGQGIAFEISATADVASIDVAAKAPNSGATAQLTANVSDSKDSVGTGIEKDITSATPQYYNLMENAGTDLVKFFADGKAYVVIRNTGKGVLSITDIKVAYGEIPGTVAYIVSEEAVTFANTVMNYVPSAEPNYDIISAEFTSATCRLFNTATMKVVTSKDVEKIKLTGVFGLNANPTIKSVEENADGQLVWTIQMRMYILGNKTYTVTGYGADGVAGTSATDEIRVKLL